MRYYLDTEFYDDGERVDLISVALVDATGNRSFYACSAEARLDRLNACRCANTLCSRCWIRKNVLPHLPPFGSLSWMSRSEMAGCLEAYVYAGAADHPRPYAFYGYYSAYDWVALCQLYGGMLNLPKAFPRFCIDLKQVALDLGNPRLPDKPKDAHNALADAHWHRSIHLALLEHENRRFLNQVIA